MRKMSNAEMFAAGIETRCDPPQIAKVATMPRQSPKVDSEHLPGMDGWKRADNVFNRGFQKHRRRKVYQISVGKRKQSPRKNHPQPKRDDSQATKGVRQRCQAALAELLASEKMFRSRKLAYHWIGKALGLHPRESRLEQLNQSQLELLLGYFHEAHMTYVTVAPARKRSHWADAKIELDAILKNGR